MRRRRSVHTRPLAGPVPAQAVGDGDQRQHRLEFLLRLVEAEVVPRLVSALARPASPPGQGDRDAAGPANPGPAAPGTMPVVAAPTLDQDLILAFADTLLRGDAGPAAAIVAGLFEDGVSAETICIELMAGAARHLGELWAQDLCSFTDVTVATAVMQQLLRDVTPRLCGAALASPATGSALLIQTPGEQHSFGVVMLADFFRAVGWAVQTPRVTDARDVARLAAKRSVDVIGFSLGAEVHLPVLRRCIAAARGAARNPSLVVMVGGPVFVARPELAGAVEADGTASTAVEAVRCAGALLHARRAAAPGPGRDAVSRARAGADRGA